jgi:NADPH:quinone reductase-like Zn-dependent oxidoreductase
LAGNEPVILTIAKKERAGLQTPPFSLQEVTMKTEQLLIDRSNIRNTKIVDSPRPAPAEGEVLLAIKGFALTANNVTYAATGEVLDYWKFFPAAKAEQGIVPVWGFAEVIESGSGALVPGERLYGFLPLASHLLIRPEARGESIVRDTAEHRRDLPAVYNTYHRVKAGSDTESARRAIFQPLLVTSYLLYDFLADNHWFGAKQIIIGSASGKTGLGLCNFLAEQRPEAPKVVGLTSAKNMDFLTSLGCCDQVISYGDITASIAQVPSVYVDMAGNAEVRSTLHHHLADNMRHSAAVGTSHWDRFKPTGDLPGARPQFFFAPAQIEKRRADWGHNELDARLDAAWRRVADASSDWMRLTLSDGLTAAKQVYRQTAAGQIPPNEGHYIRL